MSDTQTDTKAVSEAAAEFPPSVIGAMDSVPKDGEPQAMTEDELWERLKSMAPKVDEVAQLERDISNTYEQRIACARRFAAAIKRGDKQDASAQLIRWAQLAERAVKYANKLSARCAEIMADMEG